MKKNRVKLFLLIVCLLASSCTKWLTVQPKTQMLAEDMFKTEAGFKDALIGAYIDLSELYKSTVSSKSGAGEGIQVDQVTGFIEHIACQWDENTGESSSRISKMNLHEYTELGDQNYSKMFEDMYKSIANVNIILDWIENGVLKKYDGSAYYYSKAFDYEDIKGQALAIRAYLHFDLIRLWGPIPTDVNPGKLYAPYATTASIKLLRHLTYNEYMTQLNRDLDDAEVLLSPKTENDKMMMEARMREKPFLRLNGVRALRARIALWEGNRTKAAQYASEILKDKSYRLGTIDDVNKFDYILASEHIFAMMTIVTSRNNLTDLYINTVNLEEDLFAGAGTDIRRQLWTDKKKASPEEIPSKISLKYTLPLSDDSEKTDSASVLRVSTPLMRLSEVYLILIESLDIEQANIIYKEFCDSRNVVAKQLTESNRSDILISEYRKEFTAEGQLFYAYKRWGLRNMPRCSRPCGTTSYVLPIPEKEFNVN